jgi:hypothetical protein
MSGNIAAQGRIAALSRQISIFSPGASRLSASNGGPSGPFTIGDIGDANVRTGGVTRFDLYRFSTDAGARAFGRQTFFTVIKNVPANVPCPPGTTAS